MNTNSPPPANEVLSSISPISQLLAPALSVGCDAATKVFEQIFHVAEPDDPWLFAHLARYSALRKMRMDGIGDLGYAIANIANSGIFVRNASYEIRVLKATRRPDGEGGGWRRTVPNPGTSRARREYFYQPSLASNSPSLEIETAERLKLVVLWDHDNTHQLNCLELACPKQWDSSLNCVHLHWLQPIPELQRQAESPSRLEPAPRIELEDVRVEEREQGQPEAVDGRTRSG